MTGRSLLIAAVAGWWMLQSSPAPRTPDLVSIHVAVDGAATGTLTKDDFDVTIDGRASAIEAFTPPPQPVTVVLLLDKSASMETYGAIDDEIGRSFAPALRPGDRARVGGIAGKLVLAPAFSSNPRDVIASGRAAVSFRREERFGPSPLWDAVDRAAAVLETEPGLRAIVLVTDGRSTGNSTSIASAGDRAVLAGIVVNVLSESLPEIIRQNETTAARIRPGLPLERLAAATGGLVVPRDPTPTTQLPEPGPVLAKFVGDLHAMYTLGVAPAGPAGSLHRVEVKVKRPGLTARARSAYRT
jgi:Ca-activated chloride channel family protein